MFERGAETDLSFRNTVCLYARFNEVNDSEMLDMFNSQH